eukprot:s107_g33.t1
MDQHDILELDSLVTLNTDVEPYVLEWPTGDADGIAEALVLVLHVRPGGFLAAVPIGLVPEEVLAVGNAASPPGPVGPSTVFVTAGAVLDNGSLSPTGSPLSVLVVDFSEAVLPQLRPLPVPSALQFSFDPDQPFAVPTPMELLGKVQEWLEAGGDSTGLGYVTAVAEEVFEEQDQEPDGYVDSTPPQRPEGAVSTPPRTPKPRRSVKATVPGQKQPIQPEKRVTVASLAGSLQELIQANTGLSQQVQTLALRQQQLERQATAPSLQVATPQTILSQPISSALAQQRVQGASVAKAIGLPPRTSAASAPGLLSSPQVKPPELQELEADKLAACPSSSQDPLARAVLAQSEALTALVSQIAAQGSDPMLELGSGSFGGGTRGAQGRAKLQAELAAQRGSFFNAVLTSMARRMQPTIPIEGSPEDLMLKGT